MLVYDARIVPETVGRTILDAEIAAWLKTGPVLGGPTPIHVQRRAHDAFLDRDLIAVDMPPAGRIAYLGLPGPHGRVQVRVHHPVWP